MTNDDLDERFEAHKRLVKMVDDALAHRPKKVLLDTRKGKTSTAVQQVRLAWLKGGRVTKRASNEMLASLERANCKVDRQAFEAAVEAANSEIPATRHADVPRQALSADEMMQRLEKRNVDFAALRDPDGLIKTVHTLTAEMRASKNMKSAMRLSWHLANFFADQHSNPLKLPDNFRVEAAAWCAFDTSWMALNIESDAGVNAASHFLEQLDARLPSPSIQTALWTTRTYRERITHTSDEYPDVDYAERAFVSASQNGGIFAADLGDPLIHYNPANEMRLKKRALGAVVDVFGANITLEQQFKLTIDEALSLGREQEAIRIQSSLVRGLISEGRLDDAEEAGRMLFAQESGRANFMLSSRANAMHARGLIELLRGHKDVGLETLIQAADIYGQLNAKKRRQDVLHDLSKHSRSS